MDVSKHAQTGNWADEVEDEEMEMEMTAANMNAIQAGVGAMAVDEPSKSTTPQTSNMSNTSANIPIFRNSSATASHQGPALGASKWATGGANTNIPAQCRVMMTTPSPSPKKTHALLNQNTSANEPLKKSKLQSSNIPETKPIALKSIIPFAVIAILTENSKLEKDARTTKGSKSVFSPPIGPTVQNNMGSSRWATEGKMIVTQQAYVAQNTQESTAQAKELSTSPQDSTPDVQMGNTDLVARVEPPVTRRPVPLSSPASTTSMSDNSTTTGAPGNILSASKWSNTGYNNNKNPHKNPKKASEQVPNGCKPKDDGPKPKDDGPKPKDLDPKPKGPGAWKIGMVLK
ncbi:hypothetical protein EJ08DRAFT_712267 [Tothia fuscella]|uniref:Uncharacterized protein n=1 Tax=Tothia fuscella TaxID=1048955 RepID=A0A9P4NUZ5_9PEZI|nr:hypothetical protein EJ08DRAFT_712267 [Tothia fuscella]